MRLVFVGNLRSVTRPGYESDNTDASPYAFNRDTHRALADWVEDRELLTGWFGQGFIAHELRSKDRRPASLGAAPGRGRGARRSPALPSEMVNDRVNQWPLRWT